MQPRVSRRRVRAPKGCSLTPGPQHFREARHPALMGIGCDRDRVVPVTQGSRRAQGPVAIDEILEALCALGGGLRQLHAGVAITGPAFGRLVL